MREVTYVFRVVCGWTIVEAVSLDPISRERVLVMLIIPVL